ncbi:MAG: flagellar biosynthetic protein FliR [Planctomycetes bacterium]|nr:flagellar biosynthetic protein FliR [Planctomycetota bacterium]
MLELAGVIKLLPAFALVLMRVGGMMLSAPLFSSSTIPVRVKTVFVAAIAVVVFPLVRPQMHDLPLTLLGTAVAAGAEMIVGLTIGLAVNLLFVGLQLGAHMIAQQMGLGLARIFNPSMMEEDDLLAAFYVLVGTALLLTMNGHHLIISAMLDSFRALPPMTASMQPELLDTIRGLLLSSFVVALKVSVPVVVVLFLVSLLMGFLGKTVPQLNILVVGFPLRIGIGLLAIVATFGITLVVFSRGYRQTVDAVAGMIGKLGA